MSVEAASVEVLTAEVRALMVGSRQITLSVYRQLDRIKPEHCEPFGRVQDRNDKLGDDAVAVVGRHQASGALIRSDVRHVTHRVFPVANESYLHWTKHQRVQYGCYLVAQEGDYKISWRPEGRWYRCSCDRDVEDERSNWQPAADAQLDRLFDSTTNAIYFKWSDLPLIVLAGLR
jgi:hypothetical protein